MYPNYKIDEAKRTVTHKPTGIVFQFEVHPDGGWLGMATDDTIARGKGLSADELSRIASRAGDAWQWAVTGQN